MAFTHVIPVPFGNVHSHVALHNRLASQPGMKLIIGRLFHPVEFIVVHFGKVRIAFLYHHMARRTRAASAAGVFQMEADVHRDIEQRFRFSMPFVRQLALLELECLACWKEGNSRHCTRL